MAPPRLVALPTPRLRDWAKRVLPLAPATQEAPIAVWGEMTGAGPALCANQPWSLPDEVRNKAPNTPPTAGFCCNADAVPTDPARGVRVDDAYG